MREFTTVPQTAVREHVSRVFITPKKGIPLYEDVSRAFGSKFHISNGKQFSAAAETVSDETNACVTVGRNRKRAKITEADHDAAPSMKG